jgi:aminoglycoside phosphotransferase (APT) family kinase protein
VNSQRQSRARAPAGSDAAPVPAQPLASPASEAELRQWVEQTSGGAITQWQMIAGGNRCRSWAVDVTHASDGSVAELYLRYQPPRPASAEPYTVWREARIYQAIRGTPVLAPQLIAIHPSHQAILTERVRGRADYRRVETEADRVAIARQFVHTLATLHRLPISPALLPGYVPGRSMADCVRQELEIWRSMYLETAARDPLIDFALNWLFAHVPPSAGVPVLVHGDAGPGNFLFEDGRMTALLDWELAHVGDPMEDLAWFSMRSVMEPVPHFAQLLRDYSQLSEVPLDFDRIRYHRIFVSTRVVIIRHRNVTGQPANSIVSQALNRRLLVTALAEANGVALPQSVRLEAPPTPQTPFYDVCLSDLKSEIADVAREPGVVSAAKNTAKVLKYLREVDQLGSLVTHSNLVALGEVLGSAPASVEAGKTQVYQAYREGRISFAAALQCFAGCVAREAQLAAGASGGLATRQFPSLEDPRTSNHG